MSMKRLVDYPRLYDSTKLASLASDELRTEYVWLLGIAGPNGSFEWCERSIWATAYASVREKSREDLSRYLQAFLDAGLLLKWEQDGKSCWGYFAGSEKPGRLPRPSWWKRFAQSGTMAPSPPENLLLNRYPRANPVSEARECRESLTPEACIAHDTCVPLSESLSESESESVSDIRAASELNSTEGAFYVCQELMLSGTEMRWLLHDAIEAKSKRSKLPVNEIAESMVSAWRKYRELRSGDKFAKSVKAFFAEGLWDQPQIWAESSPPKNIPLAIPQRSAAAEVRRQMMEN